MLGKVEVVLGCWVMWRVILGFLGNVEDEIRVLGKVEGKT